MVYAYIRVSTDRQDVESQNIGVVKKALELGVEIDEYIKDDGVSGTVEYNERNLGALVDKTKDGDIVIVSEISRLARKVFMLFRIVEELTQRRKATIYCVKEGQVLRYNDITTTIIVAAFGMAAQIERDMISKRTIEGLERRKAMGVIMGRPLGAKSAKRKISGREQEVNAMLEKGLSLNTIAALLGVHRGTLYHFLEERNMAVDLPKQIRPRCEMKLMLDAERENILADANAGMCLGDIAKKYGVRRGAFSGWYKEPRNLDIYTILVDVQKAKRAIMNKDCGNSKQYFPQ